MPGPVRRALPTDEAVNALTHLVALVLSVAGFAGLGVLLSIDRGEADTVAAVGLFGGALILVYLSSTLYHGVSRPAAKRFLKVVDHCAIFLLIAGTYTPVALLALPGPVGWSLLAVVWTIALAGIVLRLCNAGLFARVSTPLYLAAGWAGLFWAGPVSERVGAGAAGLLLAGGLAYTIGVVFFCWRGRRYNHAVWHLFVMAGSVCHFDAIAIYLLPGVA